MVFSLVTCCDLLLENDPLSVQNPTTRLVPWPSVTCLIESGPMPVSSCFLFSLICLFVCQKAMTSNAMFWWSLLFTDVAQTEKQRTALDDCVVLWSLAPHLTQRYRTDYRALARVTMQQCSHTKCTTLSIIMLTIQQFTLKKCSTLSMSNHTAMFSYKRLNTEHHRD